MTTDAQTPKPAPISRHALREFLTAEAELAGRQRSSYGDPEGGAYIDGVRDGLTLVWERFALDTDDPELVP